MATVLGSDAFASSGDALGFPQRMGYRDGEDWLRGEGWRGEVIGYMSAWCQEKGCQKLVKIKMSHIVGIEYTKLYSLLRDTVANMSEGFVFVVSITFLPISLEVP